uniref:Uncharacterized protein n=1 Tax=Rhizophora mucronata TaxID=61149 RepID=A0A2P2P068_RHIMU
MDSICFQPFFLSLLSCSPPSNIGILHLPMVASVRFTKMQWLPHKTVRDSPNLE